MDSQHEQCAPTSDAAEAGSSYCPAEKWYITASQPTHCQGLLLL
jgi:hypothetical protein